jgi:D-sedoheptulose 7-phosphate isomerase
MRSFSDIFHAQLASHNEATAKLPDFLPVLLRISDVILNALKEGKKIIFFGNGGSAADAQHLAAEFVIRYRRNRLSLPAIALTTDTSMLTACANDFGFDTVFSRQVEGLANAGDVVIGITTSGNSTNVLAGLTEARNKGCITVAFTAEGGGKAAEIAEITFRAPSPVTAHAQECHMIAGHILCEMVDEVYVDSSK